MPVIVLGFVLVYVPPVAVPDPLPAAEIGRSKVWASRRLASSASRAGTNSEIIFKQCQGRSTGRLGHNTGYQTRKISLKVFPPTL